MLKKGKKKKKKEIEGIKRAGEFTFIRVAI